VSLEEKNIPIKITYCFDGCLMYLIQEITQKPPAEIVAFFYELAVQIAEIGAANKMAEKHGGSRRAMRKKVTDYFPGTSVPFNMLVKGQKRTMGTWNSRTNLYENQHEAYSCRVEVGFPETKQYIPEDELKAVSDALMERALLEAPMDGVKIPEFKRPVIRSNRMFEDLMNSFAGRPPKEKKRRKKKSDAKGLLK
jgi:hypothetical protein